MKKYINQQTVTSLIAFLVFVIREDIIEFTQVEAKVIFLVIGFLFAFGYSLPHFEDVKNKLREIIGKGE